MLKTGEVTDADIANLCVAAYAYSGGPFVTWDYWEDGTNNDGVVYGIKIINGIDVVIFRGSTTFLDWRRDLDTWAESPVEHPELGPLHSGFYEGMEETWLKIKTRNSKNMIFG